jgi:predicted NAD/FAD-dependent oxidoreductase
MLALHHGPAAPAQFVFDLGQLRGLEGLLSFVISGASAWVERGREATVQATIAQASGALRMHLGATLQEVRTFTEKRATFLCTPALARPALFVARGLLAAGDHVAGPYPATLEGAVRSGVAAAAALDALGRD